MQMKIRVIEDADLDVVAAFEKEIAIICFDDEAITDLQFHRKKLEEGMHKDRQGMLVAVDGSSIAGWHWLVPKKDYLSHATYVNFKTLYVHPTYRGTECSDLLVRAGRAYADSLRAVRVVGKVRFDNAPMRKVFENYGFAPTFLTVEYRPKSAPRG